MLKATRIKRSVAAFTVMTGASILLASIPARAAALTESSCKKSKLSAAETRESCFLKAQKASPDLILSTDAKAKCETAFDETIQKLNDQAESAKVPCRFNDNGDGTTISDLDTLLVWGIPDLKAAYTFDELPAFLDGLNQSQGSSCTDTNPIVCTDLPGFAGHKDWRWPTLSELAGLYGCDLASRECQGISDHEGGPLILSVPGGLWTISYVDPGGAELVWQVSSVDPTAPLVEYVDPGNAGFAIPVRGGRERPMPLPTM